MNSAESFSVPHEVLYSTFSGSLRVQVKTILALISANMSLSPCNVRQRIPMNKPLGVFLRGTWGHPLQISQLLGLSPGSNESHPCLYFSEYESFSVQCKVTHSYVWTARSLFPWNMRSPLSNISVPWALVQFKWKSPLPIFNSPESFSEHILLSSFTMYQIPVVFLLAT